MQRQTKTRTFFFLFFSWIRGKVQLLFSLLSLACTVVTFLGVLGLLPMVHWSLILLAFFGTFLCFAAAWKYDDFLRNLAPKGTVIGDRFKQ